MNVTVFGATGRTGRQIIKRAMPEGYALVAFVRETKKLRRSDPRLRVVEGDALDPSAVERAVQGQTAVIVALGSESLGKNKVRSEGTHNVVNAMTKYGITRLIVVSTLGVGASWDQQRWWGKLLLGTLLRNILADHTRQEALVKFSSLDWTIVRAGFLTGGRATGNYQVSTGHSTKAGLISRADLADFLVKQLTDDRFIRQTVTVT